MHTLVRLHKTLFKSKIVLLIAAILTVFTAFPTGLTGAAPGMLQAYAAETPEKVYTGDTAAASVLANLAYKDVAGRNI
jgi:hypothetical protein